MNYGSIGLTGSSIYYNNASGPTTALAATAAPAIDTAQIFFLMKRVTNQVE